MEMDDLFTGDVGAMTAGFPAVDSARTVDFIDDDLFGKTSRGGKGTKDGNGGASQAPPKKKKKATGFQGLGLSPEVFRGVMRLGYKVPTPIQRAALPIALSGKDLVAMARTGSGKTAAFLVPLLEKLKGHRAGVVGARAVVLSPTRELAQQTLKFATQMAKFTDLRFCLLVGGMTMNSQFSALARNPDVIIATPGRLMHLLVEVEDFRLTRTEFVVFDEADRLFEMGFAEQIKEILSDMPDIRQTLLFSATMPKKLIEFARAGLKEPETVRLDSERTVSDKLQAAFFTVRSDEKLALLVWCLQHLIPKSQQVLVFTCTRHHCDLVNQVLVEAGERSAPIYGQLDMVARKINLAKFRNRSLRVLVVTDVAARGIDIPLLDNVINYDFPDKPKLFVHRVGRVARQRRTGAAFSFVTPHEVPYMIDVSLFIGRPLSNVYLNDDGEESGYPLEGMSPEHTHYGTTNPTLVTTELEWVSNLMNRKPELDTLFAVAGNAYKQFNKTRGEASHRSVVRARSLPGGKIHPLMIVGGAAENKMQSYLTALSTFRPPQTILEVDSSKKVQAAATLTMAGKRRKHDKFIQLHKEDSARAAARATAAAEADADVGGGGGVISGSGAGSGSGSGAGAGAGAGFGDVVMGVAPRAPQGRRRLSKAARAKLKKAGRAVALAAVDASNPRPSKSERREFKKEQEKGQYIAPQRPNSMNDDAFAIKSKQRLGAVARLEESVLDLNPDETRDLLASKRIVQWDKRKKKYVKSTLGEITGSKRKVFKTADGTVLGFDGKPMGKLYEKWKKRTRRRVGEADGDYEEDTDPWGKPHGSVPFNAGGGRGSSGKHLRSELVSEAKLRKERSKQAHMAALRSKQRSNKRGVDKRSKRTMAKIEKGQAPSRSKAIVRRGGGKKRRRG